MGRRRVGSALPIPHGDDHRAAGHHGRGAEIASNVDLDEVSKLATRDKRGPNYWLEQRQYDTEAFAERWNRMGSGLT